LILQRILQTAPPSRNARSAYHAACRAPVVFPTTTLEFESDEGADVPDVPDVPDVRPPVRYHIRGNIGSVLLEEHHAVRRVRRRPRSGSINRWTRQGGAASFPSDHHQARDADQCPKQARVKLRGARRRHPRKVRPHDIRLSMPVSVCRPSHSCWDASPPARSPGRPFTDPSVR